MPWYGYVLLAVASPLFLAWASWVSVTIIRLQISIADINRRLLEREAECAFRQERAVALTERIDEIAEGVAHINGKLDAGDLSKVIKQLKVMRGEGTL